jgi:uncharacterized protein (DUF3820 family)
MARFSLVPSRRQVVFAGSGPELRTALYEVLRDQADPHHALLVEVLHAGPEAPGQLDQQEVLDRAASWVRRTRLYDKLPRPTTTRTRPRTTVIRFGKYKGVGVEEIPPDGLANLLKFEALWPQTRQAIEAHLDHLRKEPSSAIMPFGKHKGQSLADLPTGYLDWVYSSYEDTGPVLADLIAGAYRRRLRKSRVWWNEPCETLWGTIDVVLEREEFSFLPGVDDYEPFATRGFIPSEAFGGAPRKPSAWMQCRPRPQTEAEDEAINQPHTDGGLALPPMPVLFARRDRKRVFWAVLKGDLCREDGKVLVPKNSPVIKGQDRDKKPTDAGRLRIWDDTMEAIDQVASATDLEELEYRHRRAYILLGFLAQTEDWNEDANPLLEELEATHARRRGTLERREESLSQLAQSWVEDAGEEGSSPGRRRCRGRALQRLAADVQEARVHEVVRRMRSCRTLDDLADVGMWVCNHRDELTEPSLARLRGWYATFRAEITAANLSKLVGKCGGQPVTAGA